MSSPQPNQQSPSRLLYSPGWKGRSFKVKLRKRMSSILPLSQPLPTQTENVPVARAPKRKNPFSFMNSSSRKKLCNDENSDVTEEDSAIVQPNSPLSPTLFDDDIRLITSPENSTKQPKRKRVSFGETDFRSIEENETDELYSNEWKTFSELPIDLCLRSKLRIVSTYSLSALKPFGSYFNPLFAFDDKENACMPKHDITQFCSYWIHPYISWVKMFPRNLKASSAEDLSFLNDSIKNSIFSTWNQSFQNIYDLLRAGKINEFYLCSSNLTMLFKNREMDNENEVLIVPTTRGFRDTLFKQKINFTMPQLDKVSNSQKVEILNSSGPGVENPTFEADDDDIEISNHADWLEDLGVDSVKVTSSQISTNDNERKFDYTKQSMIVISPDSVHTFFNFLLNFKSLIPCSGPLAGVPPTIISDKVFLGASLQKLQTKVTSYKTPGSGVSQNALEVYGGPILPSVYQKVMKSVSENVSEFECQIVFAENTEAFHSSEADQKALTNFRRHRNSFYLPAS